MRPHRRKPTRLPHPWDSPGKNTGVGCHFLLQRMKVKSESEVAQSCPTLSGPLDCSLPGSSVHGISQARVLEWGAIAFSEYSPKYLERCDMAPFSEKCKNLTRERSTYERIRDKCELSLHTHLVLVHQLSHLSSGGSAVKNMPTVQEICRRRGFNP